MPLSRTNATGQVPDIEEPYATLASNQELIGVYVYKTNKGRLSSLGFIIKERIEAEDDVDN